MRLWWDGETPAAVERLTPSGWKNIATNVEPGWRSPVLDQHTELRVKLNGAVRSSEPITLDPIIRPIDIAAISASGASQLAVTVGELAPLGTGFLGSTIGGGLISADGTRSRWDGLLSDHVLAIATAGKTHLVGTADGVQLWIDGKPTRSWSKQNYPHIFASDYIQALAIGQHYWVGTYRGLIAIPKENLDKPELVLDGYSVFSLLAQRDGTVWAGMNGVTRLSKEWNSEQQTWPKQVYDLASFESSQGAEVLMATTARGVVSISEAGNKVISSLEATSLVHDGESVWIAAGPKGLWRGDVQRLTETTWSLLHHKGTLWAGTEKGIVNLSGGKRSMHAPIAPLPVGQAVEDLLLLKEGAVVISKQQLICLGQCPSLPNVNAIRVIDVKDEPWVVGLDKIYRPAQATLQLPGKAIDAQWWRNTLWVATDKGMYRLQ